jgi:predicted short-subunit dehydrogenase-like oxidoreductase (DUF2520 family)
VTSIGITGTGGASHAIARALIASNEDCEVWVWARQPERAEACVDLLGPRASTRTLEQLAQAQTVLLAVPDPAVGKVAAQLAEYAHGSGEQAPVALHLAGALGVEPLQPLADAGWETGVLHPLLAMHPDTPVPLWQGALCSISGSALARERAQSLVHSIGAQAIELAQDQRLRYHAAAALLAQGAVALLHRSRAELLKLGLEADVARRGLSSLLTSVAVNLHSKEPREALSGPIARGDWDTVEAHREVAGPEARELQDLVRKTLEGLLAEE